MLKDLDTVFLKPKRSLNLINMFIRAPWTLRIGIVIVVVFVTFSLIGIFYTPYNPILSVGPNYAPPSTIFVMGTTNIGQDIFSQWLIGARYTLIEGSLTALFATIFGVSVGTLSGFFRFLDGPLMRLTDLVLALPSLPLMIVISSFIKLNIYEIALLVSILSWTFTARVVRSRMISLREEPFIETAIMSGVPKSKILFVDSVRHLIPLIISYSLISINTGILTIASLEFIGAYTSPFGWGTMLSQAYSANALLSNAWWWLIIPGLSIAVLLTGFALISYTVENMYKSKK